jgi:tetratricopeptide (TPR) repeat protein
MSIRRRAVWPLLVGLAGVLPYLDAIPNGFTLDDVALVEHNPAVGSLSALPRIFVRPYWDVPGEHYGLYRPLTIASFAINRAVTGPGASGFHLVNVLLHGAVAALVWFALRRAGLHYGTALLGGLLFAVHPVHTEAVAGVAGRAELLAALFAVGAWIAHRGGGESARAGWRWRAGAGVLYLAALLSKEGTVLAPLLFWADDALRGKREGGPSLAARFVPYAAAAGVMLALRGAALGAHQGASSSIALDNPAAAVGTGPRILTALWVQVRYASLGLWPSHLSCDYSFDAIPVVRTLADPRAAAGIGLAALFAAAIVWGWKRSRPVALAAIAWTVFFLPSSNLLFPAGTIMAERLAYLPSIGVCLAIGHLGAAVAARGASGASRRARAVAVTSAAAFALTALAARTWARNPAWKDNLTLALTDAPAQPRSAKLQAGAGIFLAAAGRTAEAETYLKRALEIDPAYAQVHYNLGVILVRDGADGEAEPHLRRAIELAPGNPQPYAALARLLERGGRTAEAAKVREAAPR